MEKLEKKRHKKNYRILPFCAPLRRMQDDFFSEGPAQLGKILKIKNFFQWGEQLDNPLIII